MKKPAVPCYGCKDRSAECHANCDKYQTYAEEQEKYRNERANRRKENERPIWSPTEYKRRITENKNAHIQRY